MTVGDWITRQTHEAPPALILQILSALGADADAPESQAGHHCLAAAARSLDTLLAEHRYSRDHALELLAVDALTTLAFEHASQSPDGDAEVAVLAKQSAHTLGQLIAQRV